MIYALHTNNDIGSRDEKKIKKMEEDAIEKYMLDPYFHALVHRVHSLAIEDDTVHEKPMSSFKIEKE